MFSIITCSIKPEEAERLRKNIEATIGVPYEFIPFDNRGTGKGICQVYNECASIAKYENLCFVHEDIEFASENWGATLAEKLSEKDCGVIGFAGGRMKAKAPTGWASSYGIRTNYIRIHKGRERLRVNNPQKEEFSEVIALDGLCLFCTKERWESIKFDDQLLKGFHCYDIDFSIANRVAGFKNYVCQTVRIKHFSNGKYDIKWWDESIKLHKKWRHHLPIYIKPVSNIRKSYHEYWCHVDITQTLGKRSIFHGRPHKYILGYIITHPFKGHSYKLAGRYIKYLWTKKRSKAKSKSSQKAHH